MMHFAIKNLRQELTYWAPTAQNEYGHAGFATPVVIKRRWQDKVQQVRKPSGEEVTSSAEVFIDRDVAVGGYLMLGDQTAEATPPTDAREIQNFSSIPDLRNLDSERRAYL